MLDAELSNRLSRTDDIIAGYPPSTLPLLTPFALLSWTAAQAAFRILSLSLIVAAVIALAGWGDLARDRRWMAVFFMFAGLLAPVRTAIWLGQVSGPSIALAIIGLFMHSRGRSLTGGLLVGVSAALKPQIGAPFVLYLLLRRAWRGSGAALGVGALLLFVGLVPLLVQPRPFQVMLDWYRSAQLAAGIGFQDSVRYLDVNLDILVSIFLRNIEIVKAVSASIFIVLVAVWGWGLMKLSGKGDSLLQASTIGTLLLLPVYHRNYDLCLLLLPAAWAFSTLAHSSERLTPIVTLFLVLPSQFVSWSTVLIGLVSAGRLSPTVTESAWWRAVVMAHESWILLMLALILVARSMYDALPAAPSVAFGSDTQNRSGLKASGSVWHP